MLVLQSIHAWKVNNWEETRVVLQAKFPKAEGSSHRQQHDHPSRGSSKKQGKKRGVVCYEFHVSALQATLLNAFTQKRKVCARVRPFVRACVLCVLCVRV